MSVIFPPGPKYPKKETFDVLQLQISKDRLKLELISDNSRKLLECIKIALIYYQSFILYDRY